MHDNCRIIRVNRYTCYTFIHNYRAFQQFCCIHLVLQCPTLCPESLKQKCKLKTKQLQIQLFGKQKLITEEYEPLAGTSSFQLTSQGGDEDQEMAVDNPAIGAAPLPTYSFSN